MFCWCAGCLTDCRSGRGVGRVFGFVPNACSRTLDVSASMRNFYLYGDGQRVFSRRLTDPPFSSAGVTLAVTTTTMLLGWPHGGCQRRTVLRHEEGAWKQHREED